MKSWELVELISGADIYTLSERPAEGERLAESEGKETNGESKGYFAGIRYGIRDCLRAERHRATESP